MRPKNRRATTAGVLGAVTLLAWTAALALAQPVGLDALVRDPMRFDRRSVIVAGTVSLIEAGAGRFQTAGPSQTFTLMDAGLSIRVTAPAQPPVHLGDRVEVEGTFSFSGNQIQAYRVTWR